MACNKFALIYGICCNLFKKFLLLNFLIFICLENGWFWQILLPLWSSFQVSGALECLINNCLRQRAIWKSLYSSSTAGFYFHHLLFLLLTLLVILNITSSSAAKPLVSFAWLRCFQDKRVVFVEGTLVVW